MKTLIGITTLGMLLAVNAHAQSDTDRPNRPDPVELSIKLIAQFDQDDSATLDQEELAEALAYLHENRPRREGRRDIEQRREPPSPEEVVQKMFEKHDADGDSLLSEDELLEALSSMPRPGARRFGPRPGQG